MSSGERHYVDDEHYRTVSDDGKTSYLHKVNHSLIGRDTLVEVADHHADGTTTAYEPAGGLARLFDIRGSRK